MSIVQGDEVELDFTIHLFGQCPYRGPDDVTIDNPRETEQLQMVDCVFCIHVAVSRQPQAGDFADMRARFSAECSARRRLTWILGLAGYELTGTENTVLMGSGLLPDFDATYTGPTATLVVRWGQGVAPSSGE